MKKTIYIFLSFIVLQIALSSCATTNFPKTVKTKVGTFSYIERFRDYECNAKRGEADIRYYVRFDEETSQTDLSEAFKYLENLAQSLDENEAKVIAFADKEFDYKYNKILETYSTYAVYINLSKNRETALLSIGFMASRTNGTILSQLLATRKESLRLRLL